MSWAVTGDVGERGPAINLNVFTWLHNIQTNRFFNTVIRKVLCLGEHDHPFIWTFLKLCITSKRNESSTPRNELSRDKDIGERGPAINLNVSKRLQNIQTKQFFNTVKRTGLCLKDHNPAISSNVFEKLHTMQKKKVFNTVKTTGPCLVEHCSAISSNVFETLHTIQTKRVFNTVKWAGPCLEQHYHPFTWTLLKVCTITKRNVFLTPQKKLGRDRGCREARPSHELECV